MRREGKREEQCEGQREEQREGQREERRDGKRGVRRESAVNHCDVGQPVRLRKLAGLTEGNQWVPRGPCPQNTTHVMLVHWVAPPLIAAY